MSLKDKREAVMEAAFKAPVLNLEGYHSPPQGEVRAKLNQNESPFDVPQSIKEELAAAARTLHWNRYPENESPQLKQALARQFDLTPDHIVLGNGSNQLFQTLLTATIQPQDRILYSPPSFSLFEMFSTIYEADIVRVMQTDELILPEEAFLHAIETQQPKLVLICSPNNPTGAELSLDFLKTICEAAPGLVFWDEAYGEFSRQTAIDLIPELDNLIVSRTFSKAYSLAGLRFGYLLAQPHLSHELRKANLPYNVNLFTERVALKCLEIQDQMQTHVDQLIAERDRMWRRMNEIPEIRIYPSTANFILFQVTDAQRIFSDLQHNGILVRDVGGYPRLKNHLRVSVGTPEENTLFLETLTTIVSGR
jgi:histidinol-phosphate aminotransferase